MLTLSGGSRYTQKIFDSDIVMKNYKTKYYIKHKLRPHVRNINANDNHFYVHVR